ncbi:hypothetical protein EJ02DRAFT_469984 [Clathrospora elynae]|uniref:Uncharacterized protein n=1 Tax=Clathrospora elynae TaxID=706981 RepID=A0A6A5SBN3_9PLEO|nr:hypothetical protein EJ02DRAFT_469984 [Clathrospora elynae]
MGATGKMGTSCKPPVETGTACKLPMQMGATCKPLRWVPTAKSLVGMGAACKLPMQMGAICKPLRWVPPAKSLVGMGAACKPEIGTVCKPPRMRHRESCAIVGSFSHSFAVQKEREATSPLKSTLTTTPVSAKRWQVWTSQQFSTGNPHLSRPPPPETHQAPKQVQNTNVVWIRHHCQNVTPLSQRTMAL